MYPDDRYTIVEQSRDNGHNYFTWPDDTLSGTIDRLKGMCKLFGVQCNSKSRGVNKATALMHTLTYHATGRKMYIMKCNGFEDFLRKQGFSPLRQDDEDIINEGKVWPVWLTR